MDLPKRKTSPEMTHREMIEGCRSGSKEAWEVFFQKYTHRIYGYIEKILQSWYLHRKAQDRETICNIFDRVVDKLLLNASRMDDPVRLLFILTRNAVSEWRREQKRVKNIIRSKAEETMEYLDAPVGEDGKLTVADIASREKYLIESYEKPDGISAEQMAEAIGKLKQPYRLIMEVVVMYDVRLRENTLKEIAAKRGVPIEQIKDEANRLLGKLHEKYQALHDHERRLEIRHEKLTRLKERIALLEKDPENNREELAKLKTLELTEEAALQKQWGKKRRYIRPSSEEIAEFIGMHKDNPKRINVLICRARNELRKILSNK